MAGSSAMDDFGSEFVERKEEAIRVVARARPITSSEESRGYSVAVTCLDDQRTIEIVGEVPDTSERKKGPKAVCQQYPLDAAIPPHASQGAFFDQCGIKVLLLSALDGFASTVFAYGQTGSGKTYSLIGHESIIDRLDQRSSEQDGLLSRSVKYLFSEIKRREETDCSVDVSYCEIYNEQVRDLLNPSDSPLPVKYNPHHGFYVHNLTAQECGSKADVMRCFCAGFGRTKVASHDMNTRSNRSHCMFTVNVHSSLASSPKQVRHGRVCFVDLAGSERAKDTNATGRTLAESGQINKSLFNLGKVIAALSRRGRSKSKTVVPYRDSTLTKLLMTSIGGNCKTLMVACCSSAAEHLNETLRSLEFASRTKNIRNKPVLVLDPKESLIQELRAEIAKLRRHNQQLQSTIAHADTQPPAAGARADEEEPGFRATSRAIGQQRELREEGGEKPRGRGVRAEEDRREDEAGGRKGSGRQGGGGGEAWTVHAIAAKTRHILNDRRQRLQEEGGEEDGARERDHAFMQELRRLMSEYMLHTHTGADAPRVTGSGAEEEEEEEEEESDEEAWEVDVGSEELLQLPLDDDEDGAGLVLDVWKGDKADALAEMEELERELAKETAHTAASSARWTFPTLLTEGGGSRARRPASAKTEGVSEQRRTRPQTAGPRTQAMRDEGVSGGGRWREGGTEVRASHGGQRRAGDGSETLRDAPEDMRGRRGDRGQAGSRRGAGGGSGTNALDLDGLQRARAEAVRSTMASLDGWGSAR